MENREIARALRQTADLLEIAGEDGFRVRSYRRAADVVEGCAQALAPLAGEPARLRELPGIGATMCAHIIELVQSGRLGLREELLERFQPGMLELLQVGGLGPKTIALIWHTYRAGSLAEVEALARAGQLRQLPRLGARAEEKILRNIESYRQLSGRFRRDQVEEILPLLRAALEPVAGDASIDIAGSYRRGCETVGDLDVLVCGADYPGGGTAAAVAAAFLQLPRIEEVLGRGDNKISVRLHGGLQVDLRLLPADSRGAALQYFTGSKQHNVELRQRAQRRGMKLNEYGLYRESDGARVAGADEAGIYAALGLDWIPPELREDGSEIEAAAEHRLPRLVELSDIRGDLHMHSRATDGRCEIEEMAAAAAERGYEYVAITDHSQALAMANGLDEARALAQLARIRAAEREFQHSHPGFRILAGIEVDILADGRLDLADEVLGALDIVIGSVHSRFDQTADEMTARLRAAVANPHLDVLGHPTGRLLRRREPYAFDFEALLDACVEHRVAMEINASPERLDLNDRMARRAAQRGIPIVIDTDAHHTKHLEFMRYGVLVARRAWLQAGDVLNTRPAAALPFGAVP